MPISNCDICKLNYQHFLSNSHHPWYVKFNRITSLTINLNMFENFPTAGTPSGFSNATKVCLGESYGRELRGLDITSEKSSASAASTATMTWQKAEKITQMQFQKRISFSLN